MVSFLDPIWALVTEEFICNYSMRKLAESMPIGHNYLQRCILIDLSGQQATTREFVDSAKIGVSKPSHLGKFAHFREAHFSCKMCLYKCASTLC